MVKESKVARKKFRIDSNEGGGEDVGYKHHKIIEKTNEYVKVAYTKHNGIKITKHFRVVDTEWVLDLIREQKEIDLSNCYVENLNTSLIRMELGIHSSEPFYINVMPLNNVFFAGNTIFAALNFKYDFELNECTFAGDLSFIKNRFYGEVIIKNSHFASKLTSFRFNEFRRFTMKYNSTEKIDISFKNNYFRFPFTFSDTILYDGYIDMHYCTFDDYFYFSNITNKRGTVIIEKCEFKNDFTVKEINSNYGHFHMIDMSLGTTKCDIIDIEIGELMFKEAYFNTLTKLTLKNSVDIIFSDCFIRDFFHINLLDKRETSPLKISMAGTRNRGSIEVNDIDLLKKAIKKSLDSPKEKANTFLLLKENFSAQGNYDLEDDFHLEYRSQLRKEKNVFSRIAHRLIELTTGYGTSPTRVLLTVVFTYMTFSLFYYYLMVNGDHFVIQEHITPGIKSAFYFSAVTFITIGYGDITPNSNIATLASVIEGVFGVISISLFTVTMARKLNRD